MSNYQLIKTVQYKIEDVYDSAVRAVQNLRGHKIRNADGNLFTINISVMNSWFSPGENVIVSLSQTNNGWTEVSISSMSKSGNIALYQSKNQENLNVVFNAISQQLSSCTPIPNIVKTQSAFKGSVADELSKMKQLLDDGILTQEEFESQKQKLLK